MTRVVPLLQQERCLAFLYCFHGGAFSVWFLYVGTALLLQDQLLPGEEFLLPVSVTMETVNKRESKTQALWALF